MTDWKVRTFQGVCLPRRNLLDFKINSEAQNFIGTSWVLGSKVSFLSLRNHGWLLNNSNQMLIDYEDQTKMYLKAESSRCVLVKTIRKTPLTQILLWSRVGKIHIQASAGHPLVSEDWAIFIFLTYLFRHCLLCHGNTYHSGSGRENAAVMYI